MNTLCLTIQTESKYVCLEVKVTLFIYLLLSQNVNISLIENFKYKICCPENFNVHSLKLSNY